MKILLMSGLLVLSSVVSADELWISEAATGAPPHISKDASYYQWEKGKYVEKIKGSNGFGCLVLEDLKGRFEPSCLNAMALKAILPVYTFQTAQLEQGKTIQDIHQQIAAKYAAGEFLDPDPGAVVYMMAPNNRYYDYWGKKLVDIAPHIMLYLPKTARQAIGFNGQNGLPGYYDEYPHLSVIHIHTPINMPTKD